jgi:DNA polymerase elongation subunit (family B)
MFVAYHYDYSRKYVNYGLKNIVKQEGLEAEGRQHYDASKIADNYKKPEEWKKIKTYAEHDALDSLKLFDLMVPSFFYLCQSVPKSFQAINCTATGSQVNSFLVRSYLQDGWSIPKTSLSEQYEGAISFGIPGIYRNCLKLDANSLYPSIMLEYNIHDKFKDPKGHFYAMVKYFTEQRLEYKEKGKTNKYYKDLDQMAKIFVNSAYGLLGATGLAFNSPGNAALVTQKGRDILCGAIDWATSKDYDYWNALFLEKTGKAKKKDGEAIHYEALDDAHEDYMMYGVNE